ncbi:MAG: isoprenylcysteine carboxylmethyltransferase family protein [Gammaproteobacteria bacterium]|nr:isoprenylcysteine carboxylmethyltransferase family protein [Gammaproteobacteria bacterium]
MHALELKVPPVAVTVVFGAIMWAISTVFPAASFSLPRASVVAVAVALTGGGIALAGVLAFRRHETTVNPMKPETTASVVTSGIYGVTRNPMYLGLALALLAWAIYLANLAALLLVPAFVAYMTRFQIRPEERALSEKFGSRFEDYMAAVRRWI